jgi:23S rRNA (guanosine2251-2'-O)-methyltransferase
VLVVGNEVCGVDAEILALCERVLYLPMHGIKRSYNVAVAFGIAAHYLGWLAATPAA